jgi:hypothetical protein
LRSGFIFVFRLIAKTAGRVVQLFSNIFFSFFLKLKVKTGGEGGIRTHGGAFDPTTS